MNAINFTANLNFSQIAISSITSWITFYLCVSLLDVVFSVCIRHEKVIFDGIVPLVASQRPIQVINGRSASARSVRGLNENLFSADRQLHGFSRHFLKGQGTGENDMAGLPSKE